MRPFTLRVRSANVLPNRLSLTQRFTPSPSVLTHTSRGGSSRQPRWTCDEYIHARVHGIRSLATIAPILSLKNDDNPAMSRLTPPQVPATWTHTPEQVTTLINELIAKDRALWDKVGSLPPEECTFESVRPLSTFLCKRASERSWNMDRSSLSNLHSTFVRTNLLIHLHPISSQYLAPTPR